MKVIRFMKYVAYENYLTTYVNSGNPVDFWISLSFGMGIPGLRKLVSGLVDLMM